MTVYPIQAVFNRGEFSPKLHAREDIEHYRAGLRRGLNWLVHRHGGLTRKPGTRHIAEVKTSANRTRLVPFVFNEEQTYVLEFGDLYFRIYANGGRVEDGGGPVEVVTDYTSDEVRDIHFAQSNDVLYIAHGDHHPTQITRTSDTAWTVEDIEFEDGPYFPEDPDLTTTLVFSSTDDVLSGETVTSSGGSGASNLNDGSPSTKWNIGATSGTVNTDLGAGDEDAATGYSLQASNIPGRMIATWTFEGSANGSTWVVLDTRSGETGWVAGEIRHYAFANNTAYRYYRLNITGNDGSDTDDMELAEWKIKRSGDLMTPITLTASAVTDINSGSGFLTSDVGRMIRLKLSDGGWRWARIVTRSSTTVVTVRVYGPAIPDTKRITNWRLGAWSDVSGWPKCVGFFEERLAWANTDTDPQRVWISEVSVFKSHKVSDPLVASDALNLNILSGEANPVRWVVEGPDLLVGTAAAVRTIRQNDQSEGFGPDNVKQRRETTFGTSGVEPVLIGNTALYADRGGKKLRELGYSFEVNAYVSPELTTLSEHLFLSGIRELAYAQDPESIVWVRVGDGSLVSLTYDQSAKISGMTQVLIAGTDAIVKSIAVVPGDDTQDVLYMIVERTIDGSTVQYVEYMTPPFDPSSIELEDACFADSSIVYAGSAATTIAGLDHLIGETVGVLADGIDIGDFEVDGDGEITLPEAASKAVIGLRYSSLGITLRPPTVGQRDGGALGRRKRANDVIIDLLDAKGMKAGSYTQYLAELNGEDMTLEDVTERVVDEEFNEAPDLQTGPYRVHTEDSWRGDGSVVFETNSMYPATVRALMPGYDGEP